MLAVLHGWRGDSLGIRSAVSVAWRPYGGPWGLLFSPFDFEGCTCAHMRHCAVPLGSAQCAGVRQEPCDALVAPAVKASGEAVVEECMRVSSERDTTAGGAQWFGVLAAIPRDFEAWHGPVGGLHRGAGGVPHGVPVRASAAWTAPASRAGVPRPATCMYITRGDSSRRWLCSAVCSIPPSWS